MKILVMFLIFVITIGVVVLAFGKRLAAQGGAVSIAAE